MSANLPRPLPHPEHELGDAGDPECPCYVTGWQKGFEAGDSLAREELADSTEGTEDPGPRLN